MRFQKNLFGLFVRCFACLLLMNPALSAQETLGNQNIIALSTAKVSNSIILEKIKSTPNTFDLSTSGIISMKSQGVSDQIIEAMIVQVKSLPVIQNEDVLSMWENKVSKSLILKKMNHSPNNFNTSTDALIALKTAKVPDAIIKAMMSPPKRDSDKNMKEAKKSWIDGL